MRPTLVRLVDFSGGTDFHDALNSARGLIRAIAALGYYTDDDIWAPTEPTAHVDFVSSDEPGVLTAALTTQASVLHLASHVLGRGFDEPAFYGRAGDLPVSRVVHWLTDAGRGITAPCLFVDGCNGGTARFVRALRDCLAEPSLLIASRRMVSEGESTIFSACFYGALLQRKGRGVAALQRAEAAVLSARGGYESVTGKPSPFRALPISPSRAARRSFN
jgi:hypothetical protein